MAYGEKVLDHYENPRNVGSFESDDSVGTGTIREHRTRRHRSGHRWPLRLRILDQLLSLVLA